MSISRDDVFAWLLLFVVLSLVFSFEIPLQGLGTDYASINAIDLSIPVLLGAVLVDSYLRDDWTFELTLHRTTAAFAIVSGWIVVTLVVAWIRSPVSVLASTLWTLKFFEVMVLFLAAQRHFTTRSGWMIVRAILLSGAVVAVASLFVQSRRVRIFFDNPNSLSVFFNLVVLLGLVLAVRRDSLARAVPLAVAVAAGYALLLTGSRSGILGLVVGLATLLVLVRDRLPRYSLLYLAVGGAVGVAAAWVAVPDILLARYTNWITFEGGTIKLTNTIAAQSFRGRMVLIEKAIGLFRQQPVFGYGWYASPSRVGYLDVYYSTLLVELGTVGFVLMTLLHLEILRDWLAIHRHSVVGAAGTAWFVSILAQSVGGSFFRVPQLMFLLVLVLAAAAAIAGLDTRSIALREGESP
jgi:hypothetical protein